ncbi:MAG: cobalamin biosynthesis protein CobD [Lachnospiraceae bacterium]|nr:cobalamin biosynthesis protein CobD [Lachnospiraceae bacterium]
MRGYLSLHYIALTLGVILDQIIGDPHFMPHPVKLIGKLISFAEKRLLGEELPPLAMRDRKKEVWRGLLLWLIVIAVTGTATKLILSWSYGLNKILGVAVEAILTCYILAARSLYRESMAVSKELEKGDIEGARNALSMIVGRDTANLNEEEIAKAAVETVAENTSDGVISPLLFTMIGGPTLGMIYKAVNTMDSMLGYKNERYTNFGLVAARADDVFNFIPSRISAILMIIGTFLMGIFKRVYNVSRAVKIWQRDRYNHLSPNSAQTESVCAGALGIKLGGDHYYNGVLVSKPTIGDETRKTEIKDIKRANNLMFMAEIIAMLHALNVLASGIIRWFL